MSEKGQIKGLCLDLTELSTLRSAPVIITGREYLQAERTNYGNPAITLAINLGKEIKRHDSKLYYYGVAGPVLATVGQTGLGAMAGITGGYAYAVAERMAIAVEVSPSWHYLHMFGPHAVVMANVVFLSVPCTFNVHLMLKKEKKKSSL